MKLYCECNLFLNKEFEIKHQFSVTQQELVLTSINERTAETRFTKQSIEYKCQWTMQPDFDVSRPTIIMPIRDYSELLSKTVSNMKQNNVLNYCNFIVVDDRSTEPLRNLVKDYSYLRIDNDKGFNFSMLNNIAAFLVYRLGGKEIILWSSDVYINSENDFLNLLSKHRESNSSVSGPKLLYPPKDISFVKEADSDNITGFYPHKKGQWRNTVQYGGTIWMPSSPLQPYLPHHYMRFGNPFDSRVNCDKGVDCLTGAILAVDLENFIKLGGLNPSLAKNFQDTDYCLKMVDNDLSCHYFGKDSHFYHDESLTIATTKNDNQLLSDSVLFSKLWNEKIQNLIIGR